MLLRTTFKLHGRAWQPREPSRDPTSGGRPPRDPRCSAFAGSRAALAVPGPTRTGRRPPTRLRAKFQANVSAQQTPNHTQKTQPQGLLGDAASGNIPPCVLDRPVTRAAHSDGPCPGDSERGTSRRCLENSPVPATRAKRCTGEFGPRRASLLCTRAGAPVRVEGQAAAGGTRRAWPRGWTAECCSLVLPFSC